MKFLPRRKPKSSIAKSLLFLRSLNLRQIRLLRNNVALLLSNVGGRSTLGSSISGTLFHVFSLIGLLLFFALCAVLGLVVIDNGCSLLLLSCRSAWRGVRVLACVRIGDEENIKKGQGLKRTFVFVFGFGFCFCFFSFLVFLRLRRSLSLFLFALVASFLYFGLGVFISNSPCHRVSKDRLCLKSFARYVSIHSGFEMVSRWLRS